VLHIMNIVLWITWAPISLFTIVRCKVTSSCTGAVFFINAYYRGNLCL